MEGNNASPTEKFLSTGVPPVKGFPAYRRYPRGAQKCYKPTSTRFPFLCAALIVTLGLIALVELACRRLPIQNDTGGLFGFNITRRALADVKGVELFHRGLPSVRSVSVGQSSSAGYASPTVSPPGTTSPPAEKGPSATSPGAYLPTTTPGASVPTTAPGAYLPTTLPPAENTPSATSPGAYLPTTSPGANLPTTSPPVEESTKSAAPGDYLPTTSPGANLPTTSPPVLPVVTLILTTGPGDYLPTTTPGAYPPTTLPPVEESTKSAAPGDYLPTTSPGANLPTTSPPVLPVVTLTLTTGPGDYLPTTTPGAYPPTTLPPVEESTKSAAPGDYLPTTSPGANLPTTAPPVEESTKSAAPGDYLPTTNPDSVVQVLPTVTLINWPTNVPSAVASEYLPGGSSWVDPGIRPGYTINTAYIPSNSNNDGQDGYPSTTLPDQNLPTRTTIPDGYLPTTSNNNANAIGTSVVPVSTYTKDGSVVVEMGTQSIAPLIPVSTYTTDGSVVVEMGTQSIAPLIPVSTYTTDGSIVVQIAAQSTAPLVPVSTYTMDGSVVVEMGTTVAAPLVPVSTYTTDGSIVVEMGTTVAAPLVPVSTYTTDGYVVVELGTKATAPLVPVSTFTTDGYVVVEMGTKATASLVPVSTYTSGGFAVVVLGTPTATPTVTGSNPSGSASSVVVEAITTTSGGVVYVYMTTMTLSGTNTAPAAAKSTGTAAGDQNVCPVTAGPSPTFSPLTSAGYFTSSYLPILIAVAFRVLWTLVYNNARLMEPFYRLASPAGASGKNFLQILYLSMDFIPEPLPSLLSGHSYMLLVSTVSVLTELIAPFCSEFLTIDVHSGTAFGPGTDPNHPCTAQLMIRYLPARILQGILALIAFFILVTMWLSWNRPSGVYSNPSSIAVMASLLHHPDILSDLRSLGTNLDESEVARVSRDQTYRLAHYQADSDGMKYGIVPVLQMTKAATTSQTAYTAVLNPEGGAETIRPHTNFWRSFWRTVGDVVLGVFLLGVLGVVTAYYLDGQDDGFNRFFNSQTFGPRFILVISGGVIVTQWKRLEREVRTLQTYRRLSSSASDPSNTILLITTSTPWTTFPLALFHLEFFTALVAFCYILSEVLVIVLATVPFSVSEYWLAYLAGTYISFSILGLQILTFVALITWWRLTGPRLERVPDTVLGAWTLLANSGIRRDFEDLGTAGRKDLVDTVKGWDKKYWLGETVCDDRVVRMGIHASGNDYDSDVRFERLTGRPKHNSGRVSTISSSDVSRYS